MRRATLALLLLAGCQAAAPVPGPAARAPAVPRPPPAAPVEGAWSFATAGGRCTARVSHADATLVVTAGPEPRVTFTLRGPARGGRIAFGGADGGWTLRAAASPEGARASVPLDAAGEGRVQQLLGGGTVRQPGSRQPPLRVPDAGVSGREWFGCLARLPRG